MMTDSATLHANTLYLRIAQDQAAHANDRLIATLRPAQPRRAYRPTLRATLILCAILAAFGAGFTLSATHSALILQTTGSQVEIGVSTASHGGHFRMIGVSFHGFPHPYTVGQ